MEDNLPSGNMFSAMGSYGGGGLDLQSSIQVHHQQQQSSLHLQLLSHSRKGSTVHPLIDETFPLSIGNRQDNGQTVSMAEYSKGERGKNSASDEEPSFADDAANGHNDENGGKKNFPWHRVKWTDTMVRLLVTAVSYIVEDAAAENGGRARRKNTNLQKKGKWKSVSTVMAERGHFASPQQCEDKFNDLNKKYKRLTEILGRGTSCKVVENHSLLDAMDHIPEKAKEEVRKTLSSKHLYYEEMCSYHNGNRLHLPPDPELQHSLRLVLRSKDDHENNDVRKNPHDGVDEDDQDNEMEDCVDLVENHPSNGDRRGIYGMPGAMKRIKQCWGHENIAFGNSLYSLDYNKTFNSQPQSAHVDMNQVLPEGMEGNPLHTQWMNHQSLQLQEQKLQLKVQMLELEKQRYKWQYFCQKRDRELDMMRMKNQRLKLENDRMEFELKRKEMGANNN